MPDLTFSFSWRSLIALGSFHGLNPAMDWPFALALGIQDGGLRGVVHALVPISVGHALSIAIVAMIVWMLGSFVPQALLMVLGGVSMLLFAGYKLLTRFQHTSRIGMRVTARELVAWSFLMATAHGAGLMLVPALLAIRSDGESSAMAHSEHAHHMQPVTETGGSVVASFLAVGIHTTAMFIVAGSIAVIVYKKVGVDILRRAWINLDLVWGAALVLTGITSLVLAFYRVVA